MARSSAPGVTLYELLIVLALLAVLACVAIPSFRSLVDEWRLRAATRSLLTALAQTRVAALQAGAPGGLCPSNDGTHCAGGRAGGFIVQLEDAVHTVLAQRAFEGGVTLSTDRPVAVYYPNPRAALPVTLKLCAMPNRELSRLVIVSQTGRPRVERAGAC